MALLSCTINANGLKPVATKCCRC